MKKRTVAIVLVFVMISAYATMSVASAATYQPAGKSDIVKFNLEPRIPVTGIENTETGHSVSHLNRGGGNVENYNNFNPNGPAPR